MATVFDQVKALRQTLAESDPSVSGLLDTILQTAKANDLDERALLDSCCALYSKLSARTRALGRFAAALHSIIMGALGADPAGTKKILEGYGCDPTYMSLDRQRIGVDTESEAIANWLYQKGVTRTRMAIAGEAVAVGTNASTDTPDTDQEQDEWLVAEIVELLGDLDIGISSDTTTANFLRNFATALDTASVLNKKPLNKKKQPDNEESPIVDTSPAFAAMSLQPRRQGSYLAPTVNEVVQHQMEVERLKRADAEADAIVDRLFGKKGTR